VRARVRCTRGTVLAPRERVMRFTVPTRPGLQSLPCSVHYPAGRMPTTGWPVILFLHGAGERGSDGLRQTTVGLGPALTRFPSRYQAIVVMPQCPPAIQWSPSELEGALSALDAVLESARVDESRVYLTGISMGGFGAFALAARYPARFAAVVPVCGWGDPVTMARPLARMPMWVFHGADDGIVPVAYSREMVAAIRAAGNTGVRYTEYRTVRHNSWDMAYGDAELSGWLFRQRRPDAR
jgi:predicted peptidase